MEENNSNAPISLGEWIVTLILLMIPCVGIIMLFVWAFGDTNQTKKNFARANLIITLVLIVLYVILVISIAVLGVSMSSNMSTNSLLIHLIG